MSKPKFIVFDLDYTLWPFWIDTHVTPPFHKSPSGNKILDFHNHSVKYYPEVPTILEKLHSQGYILGIASRTSEIQGAKQLLDILGWQKYFSYTEIYPGSKTTHFSSFRKKSKIDYKDMLFFDDEQRNILDLQKIGVTSILVPDGVNENVISEGLAKFESDRSKTKK